MADDMLSDEYVDRGFEEGRASVEGGTLYVIATPIGNLEDMSPRAVRVLTSCDMVACEDTRTTQRLLQALRVAVRGTLTSYHDHNAEQKTPVLVRALEEGRSVALVCDAGTPVCSDPGFRLLRACARASIPVSPVPGASAFLATLSVSGCASDLFTFAGFMPSSSGKRKRRLRELSGLDGTLCLYEAPHRLVALLSDIVEIFGEDRYVCVGRELTKRFEEIVRGSSAEALGVFQERDRVRGECVVLIDARPKAVAVDLEDEGSEEGVQVRATALRLVGVLREQGCSPKMIKTVVAQTFSLKKRDVYALMHSEGSQ